MNSQVLVPDSLEHALSFLKKENYTIFAGGTDLMVKYKRWGGLPISPEKKIMFIGHLRELSEITMLEGFVSIGAAVLFETIVNNHKLPECLRKGAAEIASLGIRNMATIGGNICNASPAADILPPLYCLKAKIVLSSADGERELPIEEFIQGPGKTDIGEGELLSCIRFPVEKFSQHIFRKIGTRKANALAKLSFCGLAELNKNKIVDIRISFGAIAPVVINDPESEKKLIGMDKAEIEKNINEILEEYGHKIKPIDDQRSTMIYRKKVALNLLENFLVDAIWESRS